MVAGSERLEEARRSVAAARANLDWVPEDSNRRLGLASSNRARRRAKPAHQGHLAPASHAITSPSVPFAWRTASRGIPSVPCHKGCHSTPAPGPKSQRRHASTLVLPTVSCETPRPRRASCERSPLVRAFASTTPPVRKQPQAMHRLGRRAIVPLPAHRPTWRDPTGRQRSEQTDR